MNLPTSMSNFYWDLTLKDGEIIHVPPSGVPAIQRKINAKEPLVGPTRSIPFSEIKGFTMTSRRYTDVPLLEDVARAFKEPIITKDANGSDMVKARWVKKQVTQSEYNTYYAKRGYRWLSEIDGMVWVAFVQPIHQIDFNRMQYCTSEEEINLSKH